MSTKKLQKSLDAVRSDVRELAEAFWALRDDMRTLQAVTAAERQSQDAHKRSDRLATTDALSEKASASGAPGHLSTVGHYEIADDEGTRHIHRWAMEDHPIDDILAIEADDAAKLLAAIGHRQRLGILQQLLGQPSTANDIVKDLSLGTTGAAYHHLNVLQGVGLVQQEQRGVFSLVPDRVPSLFLILAGASNIVPSSVETIAEADQAEEADSPAKKKKKDS